VAEPQLKELECDIGMVRKESKKDMSSFEVVPILPDEGIESKRHEMLMIMNLMTALESFYA